MRPFYLCADSGYSSKKNREACKARGVKSVIKPKGNELDQSVYDPLKYKERAKSEHSNAWLKECRRVSTRYEKLASHFDSMVRLAAIRLCLRRLCD